MFKTMLLFNRISDALEAPEHGGTPAEYVRGSLAARQKTLGFL